jgi:hypothetical protein
MKVIIAGSRVITDSAIVEKAIAEAGFNVSEVVSGHANGVDKVGENWAWRRFIPVRCFPADWNRHGKSAGVRRNEQMAAYAEGLIAVWDNQSRGTQHMIECARIKKLKVHVHIPSAFRRDPAEYVSNGDEGSELGWALADEGMQRADDHKSEEWKAAADQAIEDTARALPQLTTDDVRGLLEKRGYGTKNCSALGARMKAARIQGWIEPAGAVKRSKISSTHCRPQPVWLSLIYQGK